MTPAPDREQQRFQSFTGMNMAQFMNATGKVPYDTYDTQNGRTFLVEGQTVTEYLPPAYGVPAIATHSRCEIQLHTRIVGTTKSPESFEITGTTRRGPCGNI